MIVFQLLGMVAFGFAILFGFSLAILLALGFGPVLRSEFWEWWGSVRGTIAHFADKGKPRA